MANDEKGIHEVNLTPLIDVGLTLVVILLLMTPLAFESSLLVRKALESARKAQTFQKEERIELKILTDEDVQLNRTVMARSGLSASLRPLLEKSANRRVIVTCADDVLHGTFVDVLDQAKSCGAADIAVTGS
jgi:biopolymer transport protein ExbD